MERLEGDLSGNEVAVQQLVGIVRDAIEDSSMLVSDINRWYRKSWRGQQPGQAVPHTQLPDPPILY